MAAMTSGENALYTINEIELKNQFELSPPACIRTEKFLNYYNQGNNAG